jgi:predicted nicotinamide N-methyase
VRILKERHPVIRSLGQEGYTPSLYGTRVWQSTFWLMDYLADHPIASDGRVMEIGCGWGLLGIYCAKVFNARVLLTDADDQVFPYAMAHARLNGVSVQTEQVRFDGIADSRLEVCNVLLGADICFWPELGSQLRRLIERAAALGVGRIMLADPGRSTFMRMAESCERALGARLIEWRSTTRAGSTGYLLVLGAG